MLYEKAFKWHSERIQKSDTDTDDTLNFVNPSRTARARGTRKKLYFYLLSVYVYLYDMSL